LSVAGNLHAEHACSHETCDVGITPFTSIISNGKSHLLLGHSQDASSLRTQLQEDNLKMKIESAGSVWCTNRRFNPTERFRKMLNVQWALRRDTKDML